MSEFIEQRIQEAIQAAKRGDKDTARNILAAIVRDNPQDVRAWYLLSQVIEDREKAIFCLEQVLKVDPQNTQARKRLQKYKSNLEYGRSNELKRTLDENNQFAKSDSINQTIPQEKGGYGTLIWMIVIIVVVLCCLCTISGFVFSEKISSFLISNLEDQISTAPVGSHTIRFHVEGVSETAVVTYTDKDGNMQQETAKLPWEVSFHNNTAGTFFLSAQNNHGVDTITCIIYLDGDELQRNQSSRLLPMCNVFLVVSEE